jgi:predicted outer membrane protein
MGSLTVEAFMLVKARFSRPSLVTASLPALVVGLSFLAVSAQAQVPRKDATNATTHASTNDADRVFLREVSGLLVRDVQLAREGATRTKSPRLRAFADSWARAADADRRRAEEIASANNALIPSTASNASTSRVREISQLPAGSFDDGFMRTAVAFMQEELQVIEKVRDKKQNDELTKLFVKDLEQALHRRINDAQAVQAAK